MAESILEPRARGARRYEGKFVVVAGAGQGIGSATARRLAQEGASVVVADFVQETAERMCRELQEFGAGATTFIGDLSRWENAVGLMDHARKAYGRIDLLVNIVGGTIWWQSFQYYTPEQIQAEVNKSLWPPLWCSRAVLPQMIEQGSGAIVNLGTHAVIGKFRVPYAAAKGGVFGLTTSLSKEVARYGIRVNCVAPNSAMAQDRVTPRSHGVDILAGELPPEELALQEEYMQKDRPIEIPLGRPGLAEEMAAAIAFLGSDDASYITGQILPVGGGMTWPF